jgi:hypothetical protein
LRFSSFAHEKVIPVAFPTLRILAFAEESRRSRTIHGHGNLLRLCARAAMIRLSAGEINIFN